MRVLVTGATGYIGSRIAAALKARGHHVVGCTRRLNDALVAYPGHSWMQVDFNRDLDARSWRPRLYKIDAVINCAGILRENAEDTYEAVHALAPRALFEACKRAGIKRVLHFSALGAESNARSSFIASKRYADNYLESLDLDWTVLAPAPVFGAGSPISKTLLALARLPIIPLIDTEGAKLAPIHIEDVTHAVVRLMECGAPLRTRIALVGPHAVHLCEYFVRLRGALGLGRAHFVALPDWLAVAPAQVAAWGGGFLDRETLALLRTNMAADCAPVCELLGHSPRAIEEFVTGSHSPADAGTAHHLFC